MALTTPAQAADPLDKYEARTFTDGSGAELKYRLLSPAKIEPNQKYPLVLFLHGAGERGDDNARQLIHGCGDFAADDVMAGHPAFVVAPQCPGGQQWVNAPWSAAAHDLPGKPSESMRLTIALLDSLEKVLPIDTDREYVTGLSMGGFGTWDIISRQPKRFAAAMPICGGGDTAQAERIKDIPIWVFHGDQDGAVKTQRSRDMVAALKAAGGSPKYTEYPGVGHNSWTATYHNREVLDWFFAQRRGQ